MKKTVVIGLDGATWKIIKPYADSGVMPTVKKILAAGVRGDLESTMPAMTGPAWATFATGKHPGHHGVFDFLLPQDSLANMKFATSRDINCQTVYEILKENGVKPILINLPATWPPRLTNEITITSLLTQGDQWIYPASLKNEFPELAKYRLTPNESLRLKERKDEYIAELQTHLEEQMAAVKRIFEAKPWDFFFYLFSHTDWISHLCFDELEDPTSQRGRELFKRIDEHLAWFVEHLPSGANLIIMSDHGFKSYKKIFYFNKWLEQEGYLRTNKASDAFRGAVTRRAKETDKLWATKKRVNLGPTIFRFLSYIPGADQAARWLYHHFIKKYLPVRLHVHVGIDFSRTKVCFPKGSYLTSAYVNKDWVYKDGTVSRAEYPRLVAEVAKKISALRDDEGNPVVARILTREEVYGADACDQAPDIFFELADYWLVGQFYSGKLFGAGVENKHDPMGIFMAMGPDFKPNATVKGMKIQDLTPLILHLNGLAIPQDCDGHVPTDVFADLSQSHALKNPVRFGPPSKMTAPAAPAPTSEKSQILSALAKIKF